MRPDGPMQPQTKNEPQITQNLRNLWLYLSTTLLALDDLYVRIEFDIKIARVDLLVLFETRQTHRR